MIWERGRSRLQALKIQRSCGWDRPRFQGTTVDEWLASEPADGFFAQVYPDTLGLGVEFNRMHAHFTAIA